MSVLARITIYPLKSFDGMNVDEATVLPSGALLHDRRFALVDASGKFVNAKRIASVHQLSIKLDPIQRTVAVKHKDRPDGEKRAREPGDTGIWHIDQDRSELQSWLSDYFSADITILENPDGGFPDDSVATGPTIVSELTWEEVSKWFVGMQVEEIRERFRANLEVAGVPPFWEDQLYRDDSKSDAFRIGNAQFVGVNPCRRCVVPSRHPRTGEVYSEFPLQFGDMRERTLPAWAPRTFFDHFYRLTTNTRGALTEPMVIRVGDLVELVQG